ncbi:MAG TPA: type II toxin-antitoxin system VapC family toxin [Bacteroidota bacterium]|nr:type II toxin-antitoxin system VapC family toxin [Bacteroidota bacterium]
MFTLDTNILISYFNDEPRVVNQLLEWRDAGEGFFISVITELEVLSLPRLTAEELTTIQNFLQQFTIIPLDSHLSRIAAEIRRLTKLGLGDSVIVGTAKLTESTLVTRDREIMKKTASVIEIQSI